jgi:PAS domain S-box-containing protein
MQNENNDWVSRIRWAVMVGLAVYLLALLGIFLQREAQYISSLWPANAVAMALLLGRSRRDWPLGLLAVLAGNVFLNLTIGSNAWSMAGYATINLFEVAIGAVLVARFIGQPVTFSNLQQTACFILCAGMVVPAITAFGGAALGSLVYGAEYWPAWRTWWVADSISVMIFAPLVLTARAGVGKLLAEPRRGLEALGLAAATLLVTLVTFSSSVFPLVYLTFPFLVAAGVRFGVFGVGVNAAVAAMTAVWLTIGGGGLTGYMPGDLASAILEVQVFLGVTVLAALAVAAVIQENRETIGKLATSEGRFRELVEHASDAIFVHDLDGNFVDVNYQACETLGYSREDLLSMKVDEVEVNSAPGGVGGIWRQLEEGGAVTVDGSHRRKDGSTFPVEV